MKHLHNYLFIFAIFVLSSTLMAQEHGSYLVRNFDPGYYHGGSKIYSLVSTTNGLLYASDKNGILEYDGEKWLKINTGFPIYSLAVNDSNILYTAGREGIGFVKCDSLNKSQYHSLNHLVTGYQNSNIFSNSQVFRVADEILFVVDNKLVVYADNQIRIIEGNNKISLAQRVGDQLYIYASQSGLYRYCKGEVSQVLTREQLTGKGLWGLMKSPEGLIILGSSGRSFLVSQDSFAEVKMEGNNYIKNYFLQGIQQLSSNSYVIKTFYNGLILVNSELQICRHIDQNDNLINNTVFGVCSDGFGNLWVGTSSGISVFRQNIPFTQYNTLAGIGTGYSALKSGDILYLGTSHGLWKNISSKSQGDEFELLFPGHIFGLNVIDDVLYFGHPSGVYALLNGKITPLSRRAGGAYIKKIPFESNRYLSNTTNGLIVFSQEDNSIKKILRPIKYLEGKNREIHNFEFDSLRNVWVEYDNGIYLFNWNSPDNKRFFTRVGKENRLKRVRRIDNELFFIADSGVYSYNHQTSKFYLSPKLERISNSNFLPTNIICDNLGEIWIFSNENLFRGKWDQSGLYCEKEPFFELLNGSYPLGYENVYSLDDSTSLIGCEEGYIHFRDSKFNVNTYSSVIIREVKISSPVNQWKRIWGEVLKQSNGFHLKMEEPISYSNNSIEFSFAPGSPNYKKVRYQSFLEGYNTQWTQWSQENVRSFTNLAPGNYKFIVRAINEHGEFSHVGMCDFEILPPWYLSPEAKFLYLIFSLLFIVGIVLLIRNLIRRAQEELLNQKNEEAQRAEQIRLQEKLKSEKEIIKLKNGQLHADNIHKSKELANLTLSLIQKNQVLIGFKEHLEQIKGYSEQNKLVTEDLRRLISKINKDIDKEENWEVFEEYFDTVHENFFIKLRKKFPNLTSKDMRLCAYLRMNLSTKEIAPLMNISARGVEIGRYRLRRKLDLDRNVNINYFLQRL